MSDRMVLIVEDQPEIGEIERLVVEEMVGVQADVAANGEIAVERVRRHKPDLILLDLMLPGLSGIEFVKRLKADPTTQDIPVVVVSAGDPDQCQRAIAIGCVGVVVKPFDVDVLADRVEACLAAYSPQA